MRGSVSGDSPDSCRCALDYTAQHGPGGGQRSQIDRAVIHSLTCVALAAIRRPLILSLLSLLAMSAESKLDSFPGEKPSASSVL